MTDGMGEVLFWVIWRSIETESKIFLLSLLFSSFPFPSLHFPSPPSLLSFLPSLILSFLPSLLTSFLSFFFFLKKIIASLTFWRLFLSRKPLCQLVSWCSDDFWTVRIICLTHFVKIIVRRLAAPSYSHIEGSPVLKRRLDATKSCGS